MTDMTKQTEAISTERALKLALEALESCGTGHISDGGSQWYDEMLVDTAIDVLREALTSVPDWASEAKEQPAPGRAHYEDGDVFERIAAMKKQPAPATELREQEPPTVAELVCVCGAEWEWRNRDWELVATPPAQRTWVHATEWRGLTDEDIASLDLSAVTVKDAISDVRAIEAKLREKNGITKEQT